MIGGEVAIADLEPIFSSFAPGVDATPRTLGRSDDVVNAERSFLHCGPHGAGHFVMDYHGIEYGVMAAYSEGPTSTTMLHRSSLQTHVVDESPEPRREIAPVREIQKEAV